ncbi:hypothetical protein CBW55_10190 [Yersinia intermedia]|nr:hypothetical protein CBW55_10190 [Yersinia intermedia]OWF91069.1 hypothetical protein B4916_11685 [Yersinia intermedia]
MLRKKFLFTVKKSTNASKQKSLNLRLTDFEAASRVTRGATAVYSPQFYCFISFLPSLAVIIFCFRPV